MTDKMSTKIKLCEWFGHRDESTGPEPGAEDPQSWFFLAVLGVAVVCYLPTVIEDAQTYPVIAEAFKSIVNCGMLILLRSFTDGN